jgi:hypothetical protein
MVAYFGHFSTTTCARLVLKRDPSGRSLIWGNVVAMVAAIGLNSLFVLAVNGAIPAATLAAQSGTALSPLAITAGPIVSVVGVVYAILGMGMGSIHFSLALFNQAREWLPARVTGRSRFWVGVTPVAALFVLMEWLLLTRQGSFTGLFWTFAVSIPLLAGIFPLLALAAGRRRGDYVPGRILRLIGHPLTVAGTYLVFLAGIFAYGLVIWQDPGQRLTAIATGLVIIGLTFLFIRQGAFSPGAVVELRLDQNGNERAIFNIVVSGERFPAEVVIRTIHGEQRLRADSGEAGLPADLRSITVSLPATPARQLKEWAHTLTPEGGSQPLAARAVVRAGAGAEQQFDLKSSAGQALTPLSGEATTVEIRL